MDWPKHITEWYDGTTGYLSIPFTWLLPTARARIRQRDFFTHRWIVGGPAVRLMPDYDLDNAHVGDDMPGVLQRVNPQATRTTEGCTRNCHFCGVRQIEGEFQELSDWPDLPIVCDNNLLAASEGHFARVIQRLRGHEFCDFNQGLDARLLTMFHARLLATLNKPILRMALDHDRDREAWAQAYDRLRSVGIVKAAIRSLILCGFDGGPGEDRDRCEFVEGFGIKASPMWFHELDSLEFNPVTPKQQSLGWTKTKRRELMCWYYQHRTLAVRG